MADLIVWRNNLTSQEWDAALAALGGHPLQSALWGDARRDVDGIHDHRWTILKNNVPVWMIRIEERHVRGSGWVAWVPRGPTGILPEDGQAALRRRLRAAGAALLVTDRWEHVNNVNEKHIPKTIWVDLSAGKEAVWSRLHPRFRQGIRRSERAGVTVDTSSSEVESDRFFNLCERLSHAKGFELRTSLPLIRRLLDHEHKSHAEARLFIARANADMAAGAFIMRLGRSIHYMWGGTDRRFSKDQVGEAVQWGAMLWGISQGCKRYDLEGIDARTNPGTYYFKTKMGGDEISLPGISYVPLMPSGYAIAVVHKHIALRGFM